MAARDPDDRIFQRFRRYVKYIRVFPDEQSAEFMMIFPYKIYDLTTRRQSSGASSFSFRSRGKSQKALDYDAAS